MVRLCYDVAMCALNLDDLTNMGIEELIRLHERLKVSCEMKLEQLGKKQFLHEMVTAKRTKDIEQLQVEVMRLQVEIDAVANQIAAMRDGDG